MAQTDILQDMLAALGQSQRERLAPELGAARPRMDERTSLDLLLEAGKLASGVRYYPGASDDWKRLFGMSPEEATALLAASDGEVPPHLGLFIAFLELYGKAREVADGLTGRHLAHAFEDVLRFQRRPPRPDRAHLLIELKKGVPLVEIGPSLVFTAGKDARGVELLYAPLRTTILRPATVVSTHSLFLDARGHGRLHVAPVAASADGLGTPLSAEKPTFSAFGHANLPVVEPGFALASPVLRMREGDRAVKVELTAARGEVRRLASAGGAALELYLSGEKGWIGPLSPQVEVSGQRIALRVSLPGASGAVVDVDPKVHGPGFAASAPVLQVLLRGEASGVGVVDLEKIALKTARIEVEVSGVKTFDLQNDFGRLNPKKAFQPFGPQPAVGGRLVVSHPEAITRNTTSFSLSLRWQGVQPSLASHYQNYQERVTNGTFTVAASFLRRDQDRGTAHKLRLFADDATALQELRVPWTPAVSSRSSAGQQVHALRQAGARWSVTAAEQWVMAKSVLASGQRPDLLERSDTVTFTLEHDFLHAAYRAEYTAALLARSALSTSTTTTDNSVSPPRTTTTTVTADVPLPTEPYTPTLQSISLGYTAASDTVDLSEPSLESFSNPDLVFFHVGPFGPWREHAYQRQQLGCADPTRIPLIPPLPVVADQSEQGGELLIGLAGVGPSESVSLLFQVAEDSANPERGAAPIAWSAMRDNHWFALSPSEISLDTTNGLRRSGIVELAIPPGATLVNTALRSGLVWLRASLDRPVDSVCLLRELAANAVEVQLDGARGNAAEHYRAALPSGSIKKLKTALAGVKSVRQPYPSFDGAPSEEETTFHARVSERLRHRERAITPWDYERLVLGAFPRVHRCKVVPHAREGSWMSPGHVLVIVVADVQNGNALDPLRPRVDLDTLDAIRDFLQARAGMGVQVHVRNPVFQAIQLDFRVRFRPGPGTDFHHLRAKLNEAIVRELSPWAFDTTRELTFGGRIHRSSLLDFVEDLSYVDYVTDFKMTSLAGDDPPVEVAVAEPRTPDAVIVSTPTHNIQRAD